MPRYRDHASISGRFSGRSSFGSSASGRQSTFRASGLDLIPAAARFHTKTVKRPARTMSRPTNTGPGIGSRAGSPDGWRSRTTTETETRHAGPHRSGRDAARAAGRTWDGCGGNGAADGGPGERRQRDSRRHALSPAKRRCGWAASSAPRGSSGSTSKNSTSCGAWSGRTARRSPVARPGIWSSGRPWAKLWPTRPVAVRLSSVPAPGR